MTPLDGLRSLLGDAVSTTLDAVRGVQSDKSGFVTDAEPLAVVRARSVDDVRAAMRFAKEHGIAVVPRGAGTGLAGGAITSAGALVIDVSGMDRVLEINADDEYAVVQPGVINDALNDAVRPLGLWFAPDPASKAISTVGGNIATNAGGLLCAKYGVTRDAVLALAVVLADGRLIRTGHRTVKGVTGYDLTALFTGSEGTLGIIVEATVRLRPLPGPAVTIGAVFPDAVSAAGASAAVTAARMRPAVMELLDGRSIEAIAAYLGEEAIVGTPLVAARESDGSAYLLLQFDGAGATVEAQTARDVLLEAGGAVQLARDEVEGERLLAIRRAFHGAVAARGQVLIEDVSVPRSRLADMFVAIERIGMEHGVWIPTVAHAGDGNLHPNFTYTGDAVPEVVWAAADELFRTALELGGTLTGEHGVGLLKRRWLTDELGEDVYELQRDIKRVFDPTGIMNPGKVFTDEG